VKLRLRPRLARGMRYGLLLVPLIFLTVFFFYPLASILIYSLFADGGLNLAGFAEVAESAYYWRTLEFTLRQALYSTALTLALALPGAYLFTRYRFPGRSLLLALTALPFVLPTVVVAAAFSALLDDNGLINRALQTIFQLDDAPLQLERSLTAILIAHVFYNYAVALRIISGYWVNQSLRIEEAARSLGAAGWRLWWHVRLPLLRPALVAAGALVFIFTFTSFGVVLILGGVRFATLEVEIYRQAVNLFDLPTAAALSLIQMLVAFALLLIYTGFQRQTPVDLARVEQIARRPSNRREEGLVVGYVVVMAGLIFVPLLALIVRSLRLDGVWSLDNFTRLTQNPRNSVLFVPPAQAIVNSLIFAAMTTVLAVFLGVIAAYLLHQRRFRWLDPIFMLPLAASAVTIGFGYTLAFADRPLPLLTSPLIYPLAHTLVALPFVVRSVLPALRAIRPGLRESAVVLGASPLRIARWIDLPLIRRGVIVGATFAFTVSMGEFGASLFIPRVDRPTLPIAIYRLIERPGAANYGQAMALSVILMLVCAVSFAVIERLRTPGTEAF